MKTKVKDNVEENVKDNFRSKSSFFWLIKMAYRDWKASRKKLLLFMASIVLGISAVVAILSFGNNLKVKIKTDSKSLMGGDYIISSRLQPSEKFLQIVDSLDYQASEINFASMAFFPKSGGSKLMKVIGFDGAFPVYGSLDCTPTAAANQYKEEKGALIDATSMLQFNLKVGDSVKVGKISLPIVGSLKQIPGQSAISASIMPPLVIPYELLEQTGLIQKGSRVAYRYYYKAEKNKDLKQLELDLLPDLDREGGDIRSHLSAGEQLGEGYGNFGKFLSVVAFTALLLGCLGIASATNIYIKEKKKSIAVMKCIGVTRKQSFLIYLIQIVFIGFLGSLLGTSLGVVLQQLFPVLIGDFLPVNIEFQIIPEIVGIGLLLGIIMSVAFSLYPLLSSWFVTPNEVLRSKDTEAKANWQLVLIVSSVIVATVFIFSYLLLGDLTYSAIFLSGIAVVFGLIRLSGGIFIFLLKKAFPKKWSFAARQGLSNLFRPGNQTIILILCVGVGLFLINTLYIASDSLIGSGSFEEREDVPNIILLDVQREEIASIEKTVGSFGQKVIDEIPVIAMKVHSINGVRATTLKNDSSNSIKDWVLDGQFRASYRNELIESEQLLEGEFIGESAPGEIIPISLDIGFKNDANLEIGDQVVFNVQGVLVETQVSSIRRIEWSQMKMNFSVLFPEGPLNQAPQSHVLTTKSSNDSITAAVQQKLVIEHPSVSVIDLRTVMNLAEGILQKIGWVINFLALFSILTGFIVLIGAVRTGKYQRLKENAMLRTVGASSKQIFQMTAIEYLLLGILGTLSGTALSVTGGFLIATFVFKTPLVLSFTSVVIIPAVVSLTVLLIGVLNNRDIIRTSPKEVLRKI